MLFIKKYGMPLIYSILIYTLLHLACFILEQINWMSYEEYLPFVISAVILIRLTDDIKDYNKDETNGRVVFPRIILTILTLYLLIFMSVWTIKSRHFLGIIIEFYILLVSLNFFQRKVSFRILKTTFIPVIIFYLYGSLKLNILVLIILILSFVVSIIFYIMKKGGKK